MKPSPDFNAEYEPRHRGDCLISKTDVAQRLGKTPRTIEHWMRQGVIPYIKIGRGRRATVLFKWADIEAHLKANFGVGIVIESCRD
jgi:excisionase family DNA binding protein